LHRYAEANQTDDFHVTAFRLLQEQLGERLDLPATAITEAVLDEHLRPRGIPEETLQLLREVFQRCNQARYARGQASEGLPQQLPKIESALRALRELSWVWLLAIAGFATASLHAQDPARQFQQANTLYAQGEHAQAAEAYLKLIGTGKTSAALLFNLGNACFQCNQLGRAIASYRRALELAPRDAELRANLQFVRNRVNSKATVRSPRWTAWSTWLTLDEWTVVTAVLGWLWFGMLTLGQWRKDWRQLVSGYTAMVGLAMGLCALGLAARAYERLGGNAGIIVTPDAMVRYGPLDESRSFYSLTDGTEVAVLDRQDRWIQVRDASRRIGWLRRDQVETVP